MLRRNRFGILSSYLFVIVASFVAVFPLFWMFSSALRPPEELFVFPPRLFPSRLSLTYYARILLENTFIRNLFNSLIITISTTAISIVLSVLAAYSLSRGKYRGKNLIASVILIAYMFPPSLLMVSLFRILTQVGLVGTRLGVILCQLTICFPYSTWLLRAYFASIPKELEESAFIDGAGPLYCLRVIILPLAMPGIVAALVFSFIASWREFLYSFIIATRTSMHPLSIGLWIQAGGDNMVWGDIMAWSSLMVVPILLFFLLMQKQIVYGLTAGSVKG